MGLLNKLVADYGESYLWLITSMYLGVKGFSGGLLKSAALPYFQRTHQVPLAAFHRLYIVAMIVPWTLKPLFGILSDVVPIFGFRKRYYVVGASACVAISSGLLAGAELNIYECMVLFSFASAGIMVCDLLLEASYSERLRAPGIRTSGNLIVSVVWVLVLFGSIVGAILVGVMADHNLVEESIFCVVLPCAILLGMSAVGKIPEKEQRRSWHAVKARMPFIIVCICLSGSAVLGAYLLFTSTPLGQMFFMIFSAIGVMAVTFAVLPPTLARCNLFMFCTSAFWIDFSGATAYFYTSACPGTPNFSYTFFTAYSTLLSSVFGIVGIVLFRAIRHNELRSIFVGVTLVQSVAASVEIAQATRFNLTLGISDEVFYLFGESIVQPAIAMMLFMPMFIMTSRLVERGSEALTYAILAGCQNFGNLVSTSIGNYFIYRYNIGGCEFKELPIALLVGHVVLPLGIVPLAYILVPRVYLD